MYIMRCSYKKQAFSAAESYILYALWYSNKLSTYSTFIKRALINIQLAEEDQEWFLYALSKKMYKASYFISLRSCVHTQIYNNMILKSFDSINGTFDSIWGFGNEM